MDFLQYNSILTQRRKEGAKYAEFKNVLYYFVFFLLLLSAYLLSFKLIREIRKYSSFRRNPFGRRSPFGSDNSCLPAFGEGYLFLHSQRTLRLLSNPSNATIAYTAE